MRYHRIIRQFRSKVEANCEIADERLNYLEQYTIGETQQIVIGYANIDADKDYKAVLYEFEERYSGPDITVITFIKRLLLGLVLRQMMQKS